MTDRLQIAAATDGALYRLSKTTPPVMSLVALAICAVGKARLFPALEPPGDEGTLAHLYQLIMLGQLPLLIGFLVSAVRRGSRHDLVWFATQVVMFVIALAAVPVLGL